jgi:hypothetical protein
MGAITNYKLYTHQTVETGFVIMTQDSEGGMVDIHPQTSCLEARGHLALDGFGNTR